MPDYKWCPIQDLPEDWKQLSADDLQALAEIWKEQQKKLEGAETLRRFNVQLQRQWAIETGVIENLYTIDCGITRLLIEKGIDASLIPHGATNKPVETILPIIKDQEHVIEGLFDFVGHSRALSTSYIKELHQALTAHQDQVEAQDQFGNRMNVALRRGDWKQYPNNPTSSDGTLHEYCPPEHVVSEMDRLIEMHLKHQANNVSPEVEAAWLHHRFAQIHPFQDGNGRVARALASIIFLRAKWFPLVIVSDSHRDNYINALEKADHGNLTDLIDLFTRLQKQAFIEALSISRDVIAGHESLKVVIASAAARLQDRLEEAKKTRQEVFTISAELERKTVETLDFVSLEVHKQFLGMEETYSCSVDRNEEGKGHWFWNQVIATANKISYYADLRTYHAWVRLKLRKERQTEIVFSFHSLGTEFLGVMAVSAFVEHRSWGEDGEATLEGLYPICGEIFQFSYNEDRRLVLPRFEKWLNNALIAGLDQWKRQL